MIKERQMRLMQGLDAACRRIGKSLHLTMLKDLLNVERLEPATPEWVIVYRTAKGFCCVYHGEPINFHEMIDVQVWAEEMEVQPYYMGL
ncbi:hypothetical protein PATSB16_11510 [Pandoraea thiooxydans]|nr:hypothetical protein PATSB16_11510 [Pandoraea thiooxydans]